MRALTLVADRKVELADVTAPAAPSAGEVQIRIRAVALNHLDLWGYRGMAFAKRKMPIVVGVEAAGEIAAVGPDAPDLHPGDGVVMSSPSAGPSNSLAGEKRSTRTVASMPCSSANSEPAASAHSYPSACRRSAWSMRRGGSNASISRTFREPTRSRAWWYGKTDG